MTAAGDDPGEEDMRRADLVAFVESQWPEWERAGIGPDEDTILSAAASAGGTDVAQLAAGLLEAFGLAGAGGKQVKTYSGTILGDLARYLIAAGLVTVLGVIMGYRPPGGVPGTLAGHPVTDQLAWVLLAATVLLAIFAPLTGYLYARRA